MTNGPKWLKIAWHWASLTLLTILLCFWIIKLVYCGHGYVTNGMTGLQNAIIHGAVVPHDQAQWKHPRWGAIALQYLGIALLTGLLSLANWSTLEKFWNDLRDHSRPE